MVKSFATQGSLPPVQNQGVGAFATAAGQRIVMMMQQQQRGTGVVNPAAPKLVKG